MKLLYDLKATQPFGNMKRHGGGKYGEVIFFRMVERKIPFSCFYDSSLWLNPDVKAVIDERYIPLYDCSNRGIQSIVDEYGFERVFSCCNFTVEITHLEHCQIYGTIHGLRGNELPMDKCFWDYKNSLQDKIKYTAKVILRKRANVIRKRNFEALYEAPNLQLITVSEHSKNALQCFYPELKDVNIPVFYSPNTSLNERGDSKLDIRQNNSEKYFFAVSGNRWPKNNARAIQAFDRLVDYGLITDVRMKVTGATRDDFKFKIKHPEVFDFMGYVSDQELELLYANAYLFVYPSLNEGFGYPPIEAMHYHVPVIASPLSSLAEICDSGALYFNPFMVEEIMNRMLMMMDPERHDEFAERGYQQYLKIIERQRQDLDGVIDFITS